MAYLGLYWVILKFVLGILAATNPFLVVHCRKLEPSFLRCTGRPVLLSSAKSKLQFVRSPHDPFLEINVPLVKKDKQFGTSINDRLTLLLCEDGDNW
jgi:hypothetical protein